MCISNKYNSFNTYYCGLFTVTLEKESYMNPSKHAYCMHVLINCFSNILFYVTHTTTIKLTQIYKKRCSNGQHNQSLEVYWRLHQLLELEQIEVNLQAREVKYSSKMN